MRRAVAFGIGHGDGDGQIRVLHAVQIGEKTLVVIGAARRVSAMRGLKQRVQAIVAQVALRAASFLAHEARQFELGEEVVAGGVDVQKAADLLTRRVLRGAGERRGFGAMRDVVAQRKRVHAGRE